MQPLRFAVFGAGFWSRYQLSAWREIDGAEPIAIYNRTRSKAEELAREFGIPSVHDDPEALLDAEKPDFIEVITGVETHPRFVHLAAKRKTPVICQKPIAPTMREAEEMVEACREAGVPLLIHENWRWQAPIRRLKREIDSGVIGTPHRARIDMVSGFPVFVNQPFLRDLEQFVLTDIGSHILDVARFLFGEAETLFCQTSRVHEDIRGEDVATVILRMTGCETVVCNLGYAENPLERDRFPETYLFLEGDRGSLELGPDFWLRVTTGEGTMLRRCPPPRYDWADPAYDVVQSSIVPCCENLLGALRGESWAETTGEDNLETARLYFGAYDSAASRQAVRLR